MRRTLLTVILVVAMVAGIGFIGVQLLPQPQRQHLSALTEVLDPAPAPEVQTGTGASGSTVTEGTGIAVVAPPAPPPGVTNLLVVGSDVRSGDGNTGYGSEPGQRSDSTMLVQVNTLAGTTTVVSIPRDLWTRMPACAGGSMDRFNAAFSRGGLNCTVRLVRELTGLPLDHVAVLDFNAFKAAVDVVGGVDVCLRAPISDPYTALRLPKGVSRLSSEQALAFARSRHSTAAGSDLARIDRQHYLLTRLVAVASKLSSSPVTAYQLVSAVEPYITVDDTFDLWSMAYLGLDVAGTTITSTTLPWRTAKSTPWGAVAVDRDRAAALLERLANPATSPAAPVPAPSASPSTSASSSPAAVASPSPSATAASAPTSASAALPDGTRISCVD